MQRVLLMTLIASAVLFQLLRSTESLAKDFGQQGNTFIIMEEGFLAMINRKLQGVDMKEQERKMQALVRKRVEEPLPVPGIKRAEEGRVFTYDPTYVLPDDIYLPGGELLYKAGTKINRLDQVPMGKRLIFIDGRDEEQLTWFEEQVELGSIQEIDRLTLVAGRPFDLEKRLGRDVYFDQSGTLTSRFGIKAVPAIVHQENEEARVLTVSEVYVDTKRYE